MSFLLFLAFNVAPDADNAQGQAFVHKLAFDIATRFGATKALFNLTRNPKSRYGSILGDLVPTAIVKIGGDQAFDTSCVGKAVYRPYGLRKSTMLCLAFEFWYDNPALSQSAYFIARRMEETITKRQEESLGVELIDVNIRRRGSQRGVLRGARARYRQLFTHQEKNS